MPFEGPKWSWGIGTLIAFVVLILCVVFWAVDKQLTGPMVLFLIGLLAVARLI